MASSLWSGSLPRFQAGPGRDIGAGPTLAAPAPAVISPPRATLFAALAPANPALNAPLALTSTTPPFAAGPDPLDPAQIPPPPEWHEFYFTRAAYSSGGGGWGRRRNSWATDYPKADIQFLTVLQRLTNLDAFNSENAVLLTDENIRRYPFLYALEVGYMNLSPPEIEGLREYLMAGGFLVIDDFWGSREWGRFRVEHESGLSHSADHRPGPRPSRVQHLL